MSFFDHYNKYKTPDFNPYAQAFPMPEQGRATAFDPYNPGQGAQLPGTQVPSGYPSQQGQYSPNAQAEYARQEQAKNAGNMSFSNQFMSAGQAPDMSGAANASSIMSQVQALGSGQPAYENFMPQHRDPYIQQLIGG